MPANHLAARTHGGSSARPGSTHSLVRGGATATHHRRGEQPNTEVNAAVHIGTGLEAIPMVYGWMTAPALGAIFAVAWLVALTGVGLMSSSQRKLGARLVMIGSIAFIPIGLIAALGARASLNRIVEADFAAENPS